MKAQPESAFTDIELALQQTFSQKQLSPQRRNRIWQMAQRRAEQSRMGLAFLWQGRWAIYPLMVALLAFSFAGGYAGVVFASGASVPGDPLYTIERHAETVWLTLTPAEERHTVQATLLERRLYEIKALLDAHQPVPPDLYQELELLLSDLEAESNAELLPWLSEYRDALQKLQREHPGIRGLQTLAAAADACVAALGGEPWGAHPSRP